MSKDSLELLCKKVLEQDLLLGLDLQQFQEKAHERRRRLAIVHAADGVQCNRLVDERLGWTSAKRRVKSSSPFSAKQCSFQYSES